MGGVGDQGCKRLHDLPPQRCLPPESVLSVSESADTAPGECAQANVGKRAVNRLYVPTRLGPPRELERVHLQRFKWPDSEHAPVYHQ